MTWCLVSVSCNTLGCIETNNTRRPFRQRISLLYPSIMRFQLPFTSMYLVKQTDNAGPTYRKWQTGCKPLQPTTILSMIHSELIMQVRWYSFCFDRELTIYSSGLPTSFRYHLPLFYHTSKSGVQKHLLRADPNLVERQVLHAMHHPLRHSNNTVTCKSTTTMPM